MLRVEDLNFSYGKNIILENINFQLEYGNLVCLLGANGAGKSTLCKCILQLLDNYKGKIFIDGLELKNLTQSQRAEKIAYIPQEYKGAFNYTVEQVVLMGTTSQSMFKTPKKEEIKKMEAALAQNSKILVMDEPTSNLDFGNQINLMQMVKDLSKEGFLILLSTHNPDFALHYRDEVVILNQRKIIAIGEPNQVMTSENLSLIYACDIVLSKIENTHIKTCIPRMSSILKLF